MNDLVEIKIALLSADDNLYSVRMVVTADVAGSTITVLEIPLTSNQVEGLLAQIMIALSANDDETLSHKSQNT